MDISRAVQLVATDHADGDFATVADVIEHTLDTLRLPEDPPVIGSWAVEGDDEVAEAYRMVLRNQDKSVPWTVAAGILAAHAGEEFLAEFAGRKL